MSNHSEEHEARVARIRHDLRAPLNAMIGYSEMILQEAQALPDQTAAGLLVKVGLNGAALLEFVDRYAEECMNQTEAKCDSGQKQQLTRNKIKDLNRDVISMIEVLKAIGLSEESMQDLDTIARACKHLEEMTSQQPSAF